MWVRHFFDHVRYGIVTCQTEGTCSRLDPRSAFRPTAVGPTLQKSKEPGNTVVPSGIVNVGSEHKVARLEIRASTR